MGFTLLIEGNETISLGTDVIGFVHVGLETPGDSRARSTHGLATLRVNGKLNTGERFILHSEALKLFK